VRAFLIDAHYGTRVDNLLEDTPYRFQSVDHFDCGIGRGSTGSPLLLMNHWISANPASPQVAELANGHDILMGQVDRCTAQRRRKPDIIAVGFYTKGDLFDVVDELNGVSIASS